MIYKSELLFNDAQRTQFADIGVYSSVLFSYEWINERYKIAPLTDSVLDAKVFCINVKSFIPFANTIDFNEIFTTEIKDKINKGALVINHATEWVHRYSGHAFTCAWDLLVEKLEAAGIDTSRVVFISGDINIEKIYKQHNDPFNVVGLNLFESLFFNRLPQLRYTFDASKFSIDKPYEFLFLNSIPRVHRCVLRYCLEKKFLLSKGIWSWATPDNSGVSEREVIDFGVKFDMLFSAEDVRRIVELSKRPKILDVANPIHGIKNINVLKQQWLNDTAYSLVTETNYNTFSESHMFITEKTYKPIYFSHPMMIFGQPGTLEYLRSLGYYTFPELFNEDYDSQASCKNINTIIDNIVMFKDRAAGNEKIINEKLQHNRALFMSQPYEEILKRKLTKIIANCG